MNTINQLKQLFFIVFALSMSISNGQQYPFQNPNLDDKDRVVDLLGRLTVQEKIDQLLYTSPAIERLGIPEYNWWNESLHGVARAGYATVFPQSITIAAAWDSDLLKEVADAISDEARAKHHEYIRRGQRGIYQGLTFWSPNINIFRDPRWGRGHETYGEDPYLTGQLGIAYVKGLQGDDPNYLKLVATAKHFAVHSGPEPLRHEFDVHPSKRDLWETYLPAFRDLVKQGDVRSVMTAYNRVYGEAASASDTLFTILRDYWDFDGYVVSDCYAISDIWKYHKIAKDAAEASAMAVIEGCDLNCGDSYEKLSEAYKQGIVTEKDLDIALSRLMEARIKLGMFDPEEVVPYAQIPFSVNTSEKHNQLALKAAKKSIVLLKNQGDLLPLSKDLKSVAVIGPNADNIQSLWGNYNGNPKDPVTVLQGIKNALGSKTTVLYEEGGPLAKGIPTMEVIPSVYLSTEDGKQGLSAQYYDNNNWEGTPVIDRIDANIDFQWDIETPDPSLKMGDYSIRWSGYITPPKTGTYSFSDWGKPFMEFEIAQQISGGGNHEHRPAIINKEIYMEKGKKYKIEVKYNNYYGNSTAKMLWGVPKEHQLEDAIAAAEKAEVVVMVLGLNERLEGEEMDVEVEGFAGGDRTALDLPASQRTLLKEIAKTGKPIVLVLLNGSALSINWAAENIPAILTAGYAGQQGGNAVAQVLFGDYNPAARLPVTYYKSVADLPDFEDYNMDGRTYRYFDKEPLYPFGYGLSYTTFDYSNFQLPSKIGMNEPIALSVEVANTGAYDGDEVIQVYLTDEKGSTPRPIRELVGFKRIHLKKGESQQVQFTIEPRQLSMINDKGDLVIEPGVFSISVGGGQPCFKTDLNAKSTTTVRKKIKVEGTTLKIDY